MGDALVAVDAGFLFRGEEALMKFCGTTALLREVHVFGHCQTNLNGPAKGAGLRRSSRQLTPLGQGGRTVLFEDVAAVEVAVVVEVVVDGSVTLTE